MCLKKIIVRMYSKEYQEYVGYKYFSPIYDKTGRKNGIQSRFQGGKRLTTKKWLKDTNEIPINCGNATETFTGFNKDGSLNWNYHREQYPPGFHIFTTLEGAKAASIHGDLYMVKYRYPVVYGIDRNQDCVVAREMYIVGKV